MKAIKTKYHPPGNVLGSRVSAYDEDRNQIFLGWDHSIDSYENHRLAAYALRNKMQWEGELIGGSLKDCYVWVFKE